MKIGSAVYIKASTDHMIAPIDPKKNLINNLFLDVCRRFQYLTKLEIKL